MREIDDHRPIVPKVMKRASTRMFITTTGTYITKEPTKIGAQLVGMMNVVFGVKR